MKPWKSDRVSIMSGLVSRLQWGHGDEAVEEGGPASLIGRGDIASMGPRR